MNIGLMSSSPHFTIMSLQRLEENYHEVCHNYLSYSAISAIVSGKDSSTFGVIMVCVSFDGGDQ